MLISRATRKFLLLGLGSCLIALLGSNAANATLIIEQGVVGGSGDVENVLFNEASLIQTGITVQGITNDSGEIVDFTGSEELTTPALGAARIVDTAGDGFDSVVIALNDPLLGFSKVQFQVQWDMVTTTPPTSGAATITAVDQFGTPFTQVFAVPQSGEVFYTVYSNDFQVGVSVTINANEAVKMTAIGELSQVRIGPTERDTTEVPEPATLSMLGAGLLGLGVMLRRRRRTD